VSGLFSSKPFDVRAERTYYGTAPEQLRDFRVLEPFYRAFLGEYRQAFDGRRVLDLGAGECLHGMFVCTTCRPAVYVNLDLFSDRMRLAATSFGAPRMRFVVGDSFKLPVATSSVDVVWASGTLFRLQPLAVVAREIHRVLGPGGVYLGTESNFWNPLVLATFVTRRPRNANDRALWPSRLHATFQRAGFTVQMRFFWRKLPWLAHSIASPSVGMIATKLLTN
jgi:ubiquinone/menaquinone biosynthesis C-methylase UbiE